MNYTPCMHSTELKNKYCNFKKWATEKRNRKKRALTRKGYCQKKEQQLPWSKSERERVAANSVFFGF